MLHTTLIVALIGTHPQGALLLLWYDHAVLLTLLFITFSNHSCTHVMTWGLTRPNLQGSWQARDPGKKCCCSSGSKAVLRQNSLCPGSLCAFLARSPTYWLRTPTSWRVICFTQTLLIELSILSKKYLRVTSTLAFDQICKYDDLPKLTCKIK